MYGLKRSKKDESGLIQGAGTGTSDDIKVTHELIETLKANLYKIVEENTLLKNVEQIFKLDTWYNSKQALDNGIITKIL